MNVWKFLLLFGLILQHVNGDDDDNSENNNSKNDQDDDENDDSSKFYFKNYLIFWSNVNWIVFIDSHTFSEHEFRIKEQIIKTGKRKGQKRFLATLCIPPYTFRRKVDANEIGNNAMFCCNGCEKFGRQVTAYGTLFNLDVENRPQYQLSMEPPVQRHICAPSPVQHLVIFTYSINNWERSLKKKIIPLGQKFFWTMLWCR